MQQQETDFGGISPGFTMMAILAVAETLCRTIASRDLADTPLYIVRQSTISSEFGAAEGCDAFTTPALDLYLRDFIGPRWRGRGPCMVINDTVLLGDIHADELERVTLGIVLHELAHILERPKLYRDRPDADSDRTKFESLVVADAIKRPAPRASVPAYFGHGASFIRTVLHLRHRATKHHAHVVPSQLCAGRHYGLSNAERYVDALGDEPDRLANDTFRSILNATPPPEFSRLWADDFIAYHKRHPLPRRSSI